MATLLSCYKGMSRSRARLALIGRPSDWAGSLPEMPNIFEKIVKNAELPYEIRKVFATAGDPAEEHRSQALLWRECVARAVMDALGYTGQSEPDKHNSILMEAQAWFKGDDIVQVFDYADLPLETTRECVIRNFPPPKIIVKKKAGLAPLHYLLTIDWKGASAAPKSKRGSDEKNNKAVGPKRNPGRKGLR